MPQADRSILATKRRLFDSSSPSSERLSSVDESGVKSLCQESPPHSSSNESKEYSVIYAPIGGALRPSTYQPLVDEPYTIMSLLDEDDQCA